MGSHECITPDRFVTLDCLVTPDVIGRLHCKEGYPVDAGYDLAVAGYDVAGAMAWRGFRFSRKGALSLLNFHRLRQAQEVVVGPDFHFARIAQEGEYILFDP